MERTYLPWVFDNWYNSIFTRNRNKFKKTKRKQMTTTTPPMVDSTAGGAIPQPPVQAPPNPNPQVMENGGSTATTNTSWGSYVQKLNWVEVGFMILGTAAFLYMIRYYKYRLHTDRESVKGLERKIDEIKADIAKMKTQKKQQTRGSF